MNKNRLLMVGLLLTGSQICGNRGGVDSSEKTGELREKFMAKIEACHAYNERAEHSDDEQNPCLELLCYDSLDSAGLDLSGRNLQGANFWHMRLPGVDFRGTKLKGADFTGAEVDGETQFDGPSTAKIESCTLPNGASSDRCSAGMFSLVQAAKQRETTEAEKVKKEIEEADRRAEKAECLRLVHEKQRREVKAKYEYYVRDVLRGLSRSGQLDDTEPFYGWEDGWSEICSKSPNGRISDRVIEKAARSHVEKAVEETVRIATLVSRSNLII